MTRKAATTATAGVASAVAGMAAVPAEDRERAFLVDQVARMEHKVERARADLAGAEEALSDARSRLASFTGDADG